MVNAERINAMKDFRVYFTYTLNINTCINNIVCKANQ